MEEINKAIESLNKKTQRIAVSIAKVEQHLKDMNGTILRHQRKLEDIDSEMKQMDHAIAGNKVALAKIMGAAITGSFLGGIFFTIILRFIGL